MKKILIAMLLILSACGASVAEDFATEYIEVIEEPQEEWQSFCANIMPTEPTSTEPPLPEPIDNTFTFQSGTLGVKFSFENARPWNFITFNRTSPGIPVLWNEIIRRDYTVVFEIAAETTHPSGWLELHANTEPFGGGRMHWQHPSEPANVFVNDHGLTIVAYKSERIRWDDTMFYTFLFVLREDGQDYREISGTQVFYSIMLDAPSDVIDEYYYHARAVVNSFYFHKNAEMNLEPSEIGKSIGITSYNFPRIDGSTSTVPLMGQIIMSMFDQGLGQNDIWGWADYVPAMASRTVPSYELLIAEYVDLILVPNPSEHVLNLAQDAGVELEFTPIAAEALVFITSTDNPVTDITKDQVLQIYTENTITNWAQLGGYDGLIIPLSRNPHSGSQTLMDNMVLYGQEIHPAHDLFQIGGMSDMISATMHPPVWQLETVSPNIFSLGYTVYFFLYQWWDEIPVRILTLDGVFPTHEAIISGEYSLATNYFAVIRADTPLNDPARKIVEWLTTAKGQDAVRAAGLGQLVL